MHVGFFASIEMKAESEFGQDDAPIPSRLGCRPRSRFGWNAFVCALLLLLPLNPAGV